MKQLIIILASIVLGIAIYNYIAGTGNDSVRSTAGKVWQRELNYKTLKDIE